MEIALCHIHLQVRKYTEKVKSFNLKLLNSKVNGLLFCLTLFDLCVLQLLVFEMMLDATQMNIYFSSYLF